MHVHMEEARVNVGCLLSFSTFFLETGSLAECGARLLVRLAGEQAPGIFLSLNASAVITRSMLLCLGFYVSAGIQTQVLVLE